VGGATCPLLASVGFCGGGFPRFAWGVGGGFLASILPGRVLGFFLGFPPLAAGVLCSVGVVSYFCLSFLL